MQRIKSRKHKFKLFHKNNIKNKIKKTQITCSFVLWYGTRHPAVAAVQLSAWCMQRQSV